MNKQPTTIFNTHQSISKCRHNLIRVNLLSTNRSSRLRRISVYWSIQVDIQMVRWKSWWRWGLGYSPWKEKAVGLRRTFIDNYSPGGIRWQKTHSLVWQMAELRINSRKKHSLIGIQMFAHCAFILGNAIHFPYEFYSFFFFVIQFYSSSYKLFLFCGQCYYRYLWNKHSICENNSSVHNIYESRRMHKKCSGAIV